MTDLLFWLAMMALLTLTATVSYFAYVVWATEKHYNEVGWDKVPDPDPWADMDRGN